MRPKAEIQWMIDHLSDQLANDTIFPMLRSYLEGQLYMALWMSGTEPVEAHKIIEALKSGDAAGLARPTRCPQGEAA